MLYPKSATGLVDKGLLAKYDKKYSDRLLEADNVYIRANGNLTRRPPLIKRGFNVRRGEILDAKSTKNHYVILRKVPLEQLNRSSELFQHASAYNSSITEEFTQRGSRTVPATQALKDEYNTNASYTVKPNSDIVAIDFYDKVSGEFNKHYSRAFGVFKHETSFMPGISTRESNRLVALTSNKENSELEGADQDPVLLGIYRNYTETSSDVEGLKYIPPVVMGFKAGITGDGSDFFQDYQKGNGWACYEEDFIYKALYRKYGDTDNLNLGDYEFVGLGYENSNVDRVSIYDDNVVFTFCGLGYTISPLGELRCIHNLGEVLPSLRDINQDNIKTYPLQRNITRARTIPLKVYLRKRNNRDLSTEEELTEDAFKEKYPEYADVLDRLDQSVSYVPLKTNTGYSLDNYYLIPDFKFTIPQTDISADCKFISKAGTEHEAAWFGVPTMRQAYFGRKGWLNVIDDPKFPLDQGISAGGIGASAVLLKRNRSREEVVTEGREPNNYIIPDYINRALKHAFEGVPVSIPQDYLDIINGVTPEKDQDEEQQEMPTEERQDAEGKFGNMPAIAFSFGDTSDFGSDLNELYNDFIQKKAKLGSIQSCRRDSSHNFCRGLDISSTALEAAESDVEEARLALSVGLETRKGIFQIKSTYTTDDAYYDQIDAVIHIEPDYSSPEFLEFFNDKSLLCLPSSDGFNGYIFEVFKKGGQVASSQDTSGTNRLVGKICEFVDGLGYVMPEWTDSSYDFLRYFTMFKRSNLLKTKPATSEILTGDNAPSVVSLALGPDNSEFIPLRFSIAGVFFPLNKANLTFTNIRNMFFSGNELSVSASEDLEANVFYEPLKLYFQWIANQTDSIPVFINMGLFDTITELKQETDPNYFTTVNSEGHADNIIEIVLLDDRLVVHTESSLSTITQDFKSVYRFADVEIITNLIKDGTSIIGAKENNIYLTAYSREQSGYTVYDLNKELKDISDINYIVDLLDSKRIALFCPNNSKTIYVLSQETDRKFKGFTKFTFPIEIVRVFKEDFDSVVVVDKNGNVYRILFVTDRNTDFTDNYISDSGEDVKSPIESSVRWMPIIAVDGNSSTLFNEQTIGRISLGIHGTPRMRMEFVSDGRDRPHTDIREVVPDKTQTITVPGTPGTPGTPDVTTCNSRIWELDREVKSFGIDFTRGINFALFTNGTVGLLDFRTGSVLDAMPVWSNIQNANMPGLVDVKCRTDRKSKTNDFVPYFLDNTFNVSTMDYSAEVDKMVLRGVYTGSGSPKSFCFLSDNIIAVLLGSIIKLIDIKKQRDRELGEIDLNSLIPQGEPLFIDSMFNSFIVVLTSLGLYRIKISSFSLLAGEDLLFSDEFKSFLSTPKGIISNGDRIYTMSSGLHRLSLSGGVNRRAGQGSASVPTGPTSEVQDAPECGIAQVARAVTLIDGTTTSEAEVTEPVDSGNRLAPGNLDTSITSEETLVGGSQTQSVSPGEAGAFEIGVTANRLSILVANEAGEVSNHTFSFSGSTFTSLEETSPHSSVDDIKAIKPYNPGTGYVNKVATGSGEVLIYETGAKPEELNHHSMPEEVDYAGFSGDYTLMVSDNLVYIFKYSSSTHYTHLISVFRYSSPIDIKGMFFIGEHLFIVKSNKVELYDQEGEPSLLLDGGTSNVFTMSSSAASFDNGKMWFLDGGEVKTRELEVINSNTPSRDIVTITTSGNETNEFTAIRNNGRTPFSYDGSLRNFRFNSPLFWDEIRQLDSTWVQRGNALRYSNGIMSKFTNKYTTASKRSIDAAGITMPAGPEIASMFVDEYRVKASTHRPVILGDGHFPECIAADEDNIYIPWFEGDVVAYNIRDKLFGFNQYKGQIDPVIGSKLAMQVGVKRPGTQDYAKQYLYNLLSMRAGLSYKLSGRSYQLPVQERDRLGAWGGMMGGVSAMTLFKDTRRDIYRRAYGVSKAYNIENKWEGNSSEAAKARNTGRKTGKVLNYGRADGDPEGSLSNNARPYIIYETARRKDLVRGHPSGSSDNNRIYDKDWNLTGGNVDPRTGLSRLLGAYELGAATYNPGFPGSFNQRIGQRYNHTISNQVDLGVATGASYRADPRYAYSLFTSSLFPAGGKITCLFADATRLYAIIQPPEGADAKLFQCNISQLSRGQIPTSITYETHNGWQRHKAKTIPNLSGWSEVTGITTKDYGDMAAEGNFDALPKLQYFDNIEWDADNSLFIGVTAWHIYAFDANLNFKAQKRIKENLEPSTYQLGYDATSDVKIQAKAINVKGKDIYMLKRKFVEASKSTFWRGASSGYFSREILEDPLFSQRACPVPGSRSNSPPRLIWGAFRYLYDWVRREWIQGLRRCGMSIPYVTKIGYNVSKRTTPRVEKTSLRVGTTVEFDVNIVEVLPPTQAEIFNKADVGSSLARAYILAENREGERYDTAVCININSLERDEESERKVPLDEKPLYVAALNDDVYIAVDDQATSIPLPDIRIKTDDEDDDDDDDDDDDCIYVGDDEYPLTYMCNPSRTVQNLPDPCDGYTWTFDTSGESFGVFRRVNNFLTSSISDTLIPVNRNSEIIGTSIPSGNRYHGLGGSTICRLPDSLKKKPEEGPRVVECPVNGETITLTQFCDENKRINSQCRVFVYDTSNATGGRSPRITGYPSGRQVTVSQDVAVISPTGTLLRGGSRFSSYLNSHSVCDLPVALKKKYVPIVQSEFTLDEICVQNKQLPPANTGMVWQFVTSSTDNEYGKVVQGSSANTRVPNNDNRIDLQTINNRVSIHSNANIASDNRYYDYRGRSLCGLPDALKKGTATQPVTKDEYSYSDICSRNETLPDPGTGMLWYFVTTAGDNSLGKFVKMASGMPNTDNRVVIGRGPNTGDLRGSTGSHRYSIYLGTNVCDLPDALKRGLVRATQFTYNQICSGGSSLYSPPSGKEWYFVTIEDSNSLGIFYLRNSGESVTDHKVAVNSNAEITRRTGRYQSYGGVNICNLPSSLRRGVRRVRPLPGDSYSLDSYCRHFSARTLKTPPAGKYWVFTVTLSDGTWAEIQIQDYDDSYDANVKVRIDTSGKIIDSAKNRASRYRSYIGTHICYLPESHKKEPPKPAQTSYPWDYLCGGSGTSGVNDAGRRLPSNLPSGKCWFFSTETNTPKFVQRNCTSRLGHDLVRVAIDSRVTHAVGRWFSKVGSYVCSVEESFRKPYVRQPTQTCPPPSMTQTERPVSAETNITNPLPAIPSGYNCKWYREFVYLRGKLLTRKYKVLAPQAKLDKYVIGTGGQVIWYTQLREVNRNGQLI